MWEPGMANARLLSGHQSIQGLMLFVEDELTTSGHVPDVGAGGGLGGIGGAGGGLGGIGGSGGGGGEGGEGGVGGGEGGASRGDLSCQ